MPEPTTDRRPSTRTQRAATNPAVRAEPAGIGSSRARDPLSREVKLLGSLLGQVIAEQAGEELLHLVERVRRLTIEIRATGRLSRQRCLRDILEGLSHDQVEDSHQGLQPLLPLDQPGRGEATGPSRAQARPDGQRRWPGGFHPGGRAPAPSRGHGRAQPSAHRRPLGRPRADGPPHRGPAAHDARGVAARVRAPRPTRRPAHHPGRGCRDPATVAGGDLAAVAHLRAAPRASVAAGRGPQRAPLLR